MILHTLPERLAAPAHGVTLQGLLERWSEVWIEAAIPGYGALAHEMAMLRKLRGAVGEVLKRSASTAAIAGNPCPWQPPCLLDVMFREQLRFNNGRHGLPKPWVIAADRRGQDLLVRLSLFGAAIDWAPAAAAALAEAVVHGVHWNTIQPGLFLPRPSIGRLAVRGAPEFAPLPAPRAVELAFRTPLEAEDADPREQPASLLGRLARRVDMMARWHDCAVSDPWATLSQAWHMLDYATDALVPVPVARRAGRGDHSFNQPMLTGALIVTGDLFPVWPILRLAERIHAGRATNAGFGRLELHSLVAGRRSRP